MGTIEFLKNVLETLWGTCAYQYMFYISLLIILYLGRCRWKKMTYAVYSIIVVVGLLTPLSVWIGEKLWEVSIAYYCRLFSMVQIIVVIAYGIMLILCKMKELAKPVSVCLFILIIMVGGNCVYGEEWFAKAENMEKIPEDVILISELFEDIEDVTIVAPNSLTSYIRQYDASIHMITERDSREQLAVQLDSDIPDVEYIMSYTGMQGGDYVITHNKDSVWEQFKTSGYEPWRSMDNYLIYEVSGYERIKKEYNEREEVVSITYYDAQGNIAVNSEGYAIVKYEYDNSARKEYEFYYGVDGSKIEVPDGYYGCGYDYGINGKISKVTYFDQYKRPVLNVKGYAIMKIEYDKNNLIIGEYYFGTHNESIMLDTGYAGKEYEYNEKGQNIKVTYVNGEKIPTMLSSGYACEVKEYNEAGKIVMRKFLNQNDQIVETSGGYAAISYQFDEQYRIIKVTYYDINGLELTVE